MKNVHAIIDSKTNIVRNKVLWDGAEWLPPRDHYVFHNCEGQIGDYWHKDSNLFYTANKKRRVVVAGKCGEIDLTQEEHTNILPILEKVYTNK
jgi:hypothetical protein